MRRTRFPIEMYRTRLPNVGLHEEAVYEGVKPMLVSLTLDAVHNSGLEFEELRAQADLLFVLALRRFDDSFGVKFSTFCYTVVHNGLIDYGKELRRHDAENRVKAVVDEDGVKDPLDFADDARATSSYTLLNELMSVSADAREITDLVLSGFATSLEKLRKIAVTRLGFSPDQFDEAVDDLRAVVQHWG